MQTTLHSALHRRSSCCNQRLHGTPVIRRTTAVVVKRSAAATGQQVVEGSSYEEIIEKLAHHALEAAQQLPDNSQYVIGIAGGPGSGKSTLAQHVAQRLNSMSQQRGLKRAAAVAPMDGFHYYKHQLDQMPDPQEAYARRGAPWTFDGDAFVAAIRKIKQQGYASLPSFDHGVGDPIEDDIIIDKNQHAVVIVEGNYLLLGAEPWVQLRELFDDAWFVDCPLDVAMQRVFERQVAIGVAPDESKKRIAGNDRPNGELVAASKGAARLLVPSSVPFAAQARR